MTNKTKDVYRGLAGRGSVSCDSCVGGPGWPRLLSRAPFLAGEGEQQQHGQVPKATEEELAGALALTMLVEAEGQVADVQVDGQRNERESPRGDVQYRAERREADQGHAVAERHPLAQCRVGD